MTQMKKAAFWPTVTLASLVAATQANAQQEATEVGQSLSESSPTMVVTATRSRSEEGQTPQRVTVITREQIEQQLMVSGPSAQEEARCTH